MKVECSTLGELCSMLYMHIVVDLFAIYSKQPVEIINITKRTKLYLFLVWINNKLETKQKNHCQKWKTQSKKKRNTLNKIGMRTKNLKLM